jgi:hypothetical protein
METASDLHVHVKGNEIFVAQSGGDFFAVYEKAKHEPVLVAQGRPTARWNFFQGPGLPPTSRRRNSA